MVGAVAAIPDRDWGVAARLAGGKNITLQRFCHHHHTVRFVRIHQLSFYPLAGYPGIISTNSGVLALSVPASMYGEHFVVITYIIVLFLSLYRA
jgi:hypothetical protein